MIEPLLDKRTDGLFILTCGFTTELVNWAQSSEFWLLWLLKSIV